MQQVTVGTKYQVVIPKEVRRKIKDIKPGQQVKIYSEDESTITIKITPKDWIARTYGMMAEAWKGIDTTQYLNDLRNEWEERLAEQAKIWKSSKISISERNKKSSKR